MHRNSIVGDYAVYAEQLVSSGIQGNVVLAECFHTEEKLVAKITKLNSKRQKERYTNEVAVLKVLTSCSKVVQIKASYQYEKVGVTILEKMPFDLMSIIENELLKSTQHRMNIFTKVCYAVKECHDRGVAHLDIKPENILVTKDLRDVKLCDFGNSAILNASGLVKPSGGTLVYASPELLSKQKVNGKLADIWSLGILFHVLMTDFWPYRSAESSSLKTLIKEGNITPNHTLTEKQLQFLHTMLQVKPEDRCDIDTLCQHLEKKKASKLKFWYSKSLPVSV